MIKAITIQACSTIFCVDMQYIESIHKGTASTRSFLSELKKNGNESTHKIFSLSRLIDKERKEKSEQQKLIMLRSKDCIVGLLVDSIGPPAELADNSILPLPPALTKKCFDYFPEVAVIEGAAVPLLTPENIHLLTTTNR